MSAKSDDFVAVASELHEAWRASVLRADGVFDHRVTADAALAKLDFAALPPEWRAENLAAAKGAIAAIVTSVTVEDAAAKIHEDWLTRNDAWAPEELKRPYAKLSEDEKEKDREVARIAARLTHRPLSDPTHST